MVWGYAYIIQKSHFILAPGFSHFHTPIQYNNMYAHERQLHGFCGLCPSASASINVLSSLRQFPTLFVGDVGSLPFHSRPAIPPPFRSQDQSLAVLLYRTCFLTVAWDITFKTLRLVTLTGIIYDVPLNRYSREDFFFFSPGKSDGCPRLPPAAATATVTERTKTNNYSIFGVYSKWDVAARTSGLNLKLFFFLLKKKYSETPTTAEHCWKQVIRWSYTKIKN